MEQSPNSAEFETFRQKLISRKHELSQRVDKLEHDIHYHDLTADWREQATERENGEALVSVGISAEQELDLVKLALIRIDIGEYFSCRSCGAPIPRARLEVVPYSSLCVKCVYLLDQ